MCAIQRVDSREAQIVDDKEWAGFEAMDNDTDAVVDTAESISGEVAGLQT